ncbi:MAG: hypothetical protein DMG96_39645 [Acidobacteria bacterium]|nr:MAG: hypothetical protein DMG96_39645 [Acidobacteriota bacterium]
MEYRLNEKLKQAKAGKSDQSAYACVVGFRVKRVALGKLKEETDESSCSRQLSWLRPTPEVAASWNNSDDAVRDGAYSVALAAVEVELGFVSLLRAEKKTGADY